MKRKERKKNKVSFLTGEEDSDQRLKEDGEVGRPTVVIK